jgi:hypothetical protein
MNKVGEGYLPSGAGNISASFSMKKSACALYSIKIQHDVKIAVKSFNNTGLFWVK